jgi:hypothetical protein
MKASQFDNLDFDDKVLEVHRKGEFVTNIRYYQHKVNLYLIGNSYVEVFYNHRKDEIDKIKSMDWSHSRLKFYLDQIKLAY